MYAIISIKNDDLCIDIISFPFLCVAELCEAKRSTTNERAKRESELTLIQLILPHYTHEAERSEASVCSVGNETN